jgi:hypothetical protein
MAHHPPGEEFIIPRIELVLAQPLVVRKTVKKPGIFENDRAIGSSAAREIRNTTVDVC